MNQIKIDKDIPVPPLRRGNESKYPLGSLEVGESFFVNASQGKLASASVQHGKRHNKKFTTRSENGGTRVWRIA